MEPRNRLNVKEMDKNLQGHLFKRWPHKKKEKEKPYNLEENGVHLLPKAQNHAQLLFIFILIEGTLLQIGLLIFTAPAESV